MRQTLTGGIANRIIQNTREPHSYEFGQASKSFTDHPHGMAMVRGLSIDQHWMLAIFNPILPIVQEQTPSALCTKIKLQRNN